MIEFFAPGIPKAMQTGTVVKTARGSFPVRRHTEWGSYVALVAAEHKPEALLTGPLRVSLAFRVPAPKKPTRVRPTGRPDLDNLAKGLLDALNGVLWVDDSQVVELVLTKWYDGEPGLWVQVEALT